ncbi:MAG TPA: hypothetical protein VG916_00130 [Gemmatimonadaceae bacterium]|nr:hypothetical protein [Gemmatimonadaceae bacterium]
MRALQAADLAPPVSRTDGFVRRFPAVAHGVAGALLYGIVVTAFGLAATPSAFVVARLAPPLLHAHAWWQWPALGVLAGAAAFLWGFSLLAVVPVFNALLPTRIRPYSGGYFATAAIPWYLHNGLFYLVRFTVLPFVTMTPIGTLFLRAMGMRMGRRPRITTELLSDVRLITLGDDVTLGGSATIFCHYGGNGRLVIAPVVIGDRATVGEKATVMGDVVIGEGATVMPHAVVLPRTRIGPRERWGGAPARRISHDEWEATKAEIGISR